MTEQPCRCDKLSGIRRSLTDAPMVFASNEPEWPTPLQKKNYKNTNASGGGT